MDDYADFAYVSTANVLTKLPKAYNDHSTDLTYHLINKVARLIRLSSLSAYRFCPTLPKSSAETLILFVLKSDSNFRLYVGPGSPPLYGIFVAAALREDLCLSYVASAKKDLCGARSSLRANRDDNPLFPGCLGPYTAGGSLAGYTAMGQGTHQDLCRVR